MIARFKVVSVVRTSALRENGSTYERVSAFLTPLYAEFEGEDDNDPVENVLWDVKQSSIPSDFDIGNKATVGSDSCIEIQIEQGELCAGQIVDVSIEVVPAHA